MSNQAWDWIYCKRLLLAHNSFSKPLMLGLFSLEKRRLRGGWRAAFPYLKGGWMKEGDRLLSGVCCDRPKGNGFKLKEGRLRLDIKKFFTIKVVKHWNRLPRVVVDAPSMKTFQVRLDRAWNT